ncbi:MULTISPECIES: dihydrodipicolinate synthase family protein [unclassified Chelatococcus]|uniref:dihydrodipicolinate synthase family protein n=1 Tax=unclassified Chelatococcus TaxID=2638111 RepID=UPI001BCC6AC2|nr:MULTISPECIES: dihydrodipicolinate synthase family protein [unclassified Chelatococcus]CAH1654225.1 Dihydrodipicolinate synthase family protein [Hyphomicrobiales bacterium]MBS7742809.1 dihydrodipicolinate synthase family protein [Chelatococcus sp. HY11]MBX3542073.1 dihydrodipicolinate synthase family protein [Chelatococcus sp.]MCO5074035.1 dihydrodipicolinate synthase family protein [Chelatococcus sp.]CAH1694823.1 Dihydrodipicolinate synthase family protein [Hyphomicrobiales bacterium]
MTSIRGVWAASATPFGADGAINADRLADHCKWLLAQGCDGLSLFGTSGEGTSLGFVERRGALEAVIEAGIPPGLVMPATGGCDLATTVALTSHAAGLGCAAALVLPPFYYKPADESGLFDYFSAVIDGCARTGAQIGLVLYNFPFMTGVSISATLVRRLADAFPGSVVGVKDSSLDWRTTLRYIKTLPELSIFAGEDRHLRAAIRIGGAGSISGTSNFAPGLLVRNYRSEDDATARSELERFIDVFVGHQDAPFLQSCKAVTAVVRREPEWLAVRPPLRAADISTGTMLLEEFHKAGLTL